MYCRSQIQNFLKAETFVSRKKKGKSLQYSYGSLHFNANAAETFSIGSQQYGQ